MNVSQLDAVLTNVSNRLNDQRNAIQSGIDQIGSAGSVLAGIPASFAAEITEIDAFDGTNAYEASVKAKLSLILAEAAALKTVTDAIAAANAG